ncbi:MAG: phosphoribosylaminoimidazole succinocarboxamide synthase [Candidatus Lambdaproteobacteria bacterium]|nr:phosphoribosylaminoimidazole succinocarboxamide synthase [Candidatus Lambdaproteobacteria bacterium]
MELIYAGSVKNLYRAAEPDGVWFEYTDDYSVFDWGKMPDPIPGKGNALAAIGEWFFRQVEDAARWQALGLDALEEARGRFPVPHHFLRREGRRLLMTRVEIPPVRPRTVGGTLIYDYGYPAAPRQLLPLEVIFRFGSPAGSSVLARKEWYAFPIHPGAEFETPLIEFSTKLETKDRVLTYQEAALVLKGSAALLAELHARTLAVALFLRRTFEARGMKLWDGKLEWGMVDGRLTLVDSIGPDELRVSLGDAVFSKQFLRDYYLGSAWERAVVRAKALAQQRGTADWKRIVREELRVLPEPLSPPYFEAATALYLDFHAILVEGRPSARFAEAVRRLPPPPQ